MNFFESKSISDGSGRRRKNLDRQSTCYVRVLILFSRVFFFICLITKMCEGY